MYIQREIFCLLSYNYVQDDGPTQISTCRTERLYNNTYENLHNAYDGDNTIKPRHHEHLIFSHT